MKYKNYTITKGVQTVQTKAIPIGTKIYIARLNGTTQGFYVGVTLGKLKQLINSLPTTK